MAVDPQDGLQEMADLWSAPTADALHRVLVLHPPVRETADAFEPYLLLSKHHEAEPEQNTYIGINRALNQLAGAHAGLQWLPHYVSLRNRTSWFRDTNIWLSKLIQEVRAVNPAIANFYCAHCRGFLGAKEETKYLKTVGGQAYQ